MNEWMNVVCVCCRWMIDHLATLHDQRFNLIFADLKNCLKRYCKTLEYRVTCSSLTQTTSQLVCDTDKVQAQAFWFLNFRFMIEYGQEWDSAGAQIEGFLESRSNCISCRIILGDIHTKVKHPTSYQELPGATFVLGGERPLEGKMSYLCAMWKFTRHSEQK